MLISGTSGQFDHMDTDMISYKRNIPVLSVTNPMEYSDGDMHRRSARNIAQRLLSKYFDLIYSRSPAESKMTNFQDFLKLIR